MDYIKDTFENTNKIGICIFPADTLTNFDLADKMVDFTKFYIQRLNTICSTPFKIEIHQSIDLGLQRLHEKYDHILFIAAGARIFDSTIIFDINNEINNNPNYMVAGHILEWKEHWYEIHHQFVLVNTENWSKSNKPLYGGWGMNSSILPVIQRSVENFHDDYTPLWIKGTGKEEKQSHSKQGWNILSESIKNNFDVLNWSQKIRNKRTYYYPESNSDKFLECLNNKTTDPSLNINQRKLLALGSNVKDQIWLTNSENMVLSDKHPDRTYNTIVLPAAGLKFLEPFKSNLLRENGKLIIYDFNSKSLEWIKLIKNSTETDIEELIRTFEHRSQFQISGKKVFAYLPEETFTEDFHNNINESYKHFGGIEKTVEYLKAFRAANVEFTTIDLINDPTELTSKIESKNAFINISNIYATDFTNTFVTRKKLKESFYILQRHLPHDTILTGFTPEAEYLDEPVFDENELKRTNALENLSGDRDQLIVKHIMKVDKEKKDSLGHASAHIGRPGNVKYHDFEEPVALRDFTPSNGKERLVFTICPSWGVIFPPYGLSKIVGAARKGGYACKVYDLNVQLYHNLLKRTGQDYWASEKFFFWEDKWFFNEYLLKEIEEYLHAAAVKMLSDKPTMIGLSLYTTNANASLVLIEKLKELDPDVIIIAGGPAVATEENMMKTQFAKYVSYFFKGESEESFLEFLDNEVFKETLPLMGKTIGSTDSRLSLDDQAYADFQDYDLTSYLHQDGISIETSRGCVAQCSFCAETYFWKFRSMAPERTVEEMKHHVENYGVKRFWFVDSLVNGNIKSFRQLVDLIIANNLNIGWNSYSRCDGRMDKEFLDTVAKSGCTALSYGVESGSQKVLNDMRKKIQIWEIENNLRDTYNTGTIFTHVNWLIGFPTEEYIDYYHSNILIYNTRNSIHELSPGMGCGPSALSDLQERFAIYDIAWKEKVWDNQFLGDWYTTGYRNTKMTRFIRVKMFHIWMEILNAFTESKVSNSQRHGDIQDCYTFKTLGNFEHPDYIPQEDNLNFALIKEVPSYSAQSLYLSNEYFSVIYGLYRIFNSFELVINFEPEKDIMSWGSIATNYASSMEVRVESDGTFKFNLYHKFKHKGQTPKMEDILKWERDNEHGDLSFQDTIELQGNITSVEVDKVITKPTIHEMYRKKDRPVTLTQSRVPPIELPNIVIE